MFKKEDAFLNIGPMVGLDILDFLELNAAWEHIWDEATWGSFQIGAKFEF